MEAYGDSDCKRVTEVLKSVRKKLGFYASKDVIKKLAVKGKVEQQSEPQQGSFKRKFYTRGHLSLFIPAH